MGFINRLKNKTAKPHLNFMGGPSYDLTDPLQTLRVMAASCFFGVVASCWGRVTWC